VHVIDRDQRPLVVSVQEVHNLAWMQVIFWSVDASVLANRKAPAFTCEWFDRTSSAISMSGVSAFAAEKTGEWFMRRARGITQVHTVWEDRNFGRGK
jgi:hypothetical protein